MPRFERSSEGGRGGSKPGYPRRDTRGPKESSRAPRDGSKGPSRFGSRDSGRSPSFSRGAGGFNRDSSRGPSKYGRDKPDFKMTQVICASCGDSCEVPFRPTSDKPVYCDACFGKRGRDSSSRSDSQSSSINLDEINAKLDKIMKALEIR